MGQQLKSTDECQVRWSDGWAVCQGVPIFEGAPIRSKVDASTPPSRGRRCPPLISSKRGMSRGTLVHNRSKISRAACPSFRLASSRRG